MIDLLVAGGIVYFTAPTPRSPEPRAARLDLTPTFAPGTAGLVAAGRF